MISLPLSVRWHTRKPSWPLTCTPGSRKVRLKEDRGGCIAARILQKGTATCFTKPPLGRLSSCFGRRLSANRGSRATNGPWSGKTDYWPLPATAAESPVRGRQSNSASAARSAAPRASCLQSFSAQRPGAPWKRTGVGGGPRARSLSFHFKLLCMQPLYVRSASWRGSLLGIYIKLAPLCVMLFPVHVFPCLYPCICLSTGGSRMLHPLGLEVERREGWWVECKLKNPHRSIAGWPVLLTLGPLTLSCRLCGRRESSRPAGHSSDMPSRTFVIA